MNWAYEDVRALPRDVYGILVDELNKRNEGTDE